MSDEQAVVVLLLLPLAGFLVTALIGRRLGPRAWTIAVPAIVVTWLIALLVISRALGGEYGDDGLRFTLYRRKAGDRVEYTTWFSFSANRRSSR